MKTPSDGDVTFDTSRSSNIHLPGDVAGDAWIEISLGLVNAIETISVFSKRDCSVSDLSGLQAFSKIRAGEYKKLTKKGWRDPDNTQDCVQQFVNYGWVEADRVKVKDSGAFVEGSNTLMNVADVVVVRAVHMFLGGYIVT